MVSEDILERCFQDAQKYNACVAAVPVKDTIKIADENGFAETTPRRDRVWQVQTPQTFSFGLIYDAYARLAEQKILWRKKESKLRMTRWWWRHLQIIR